MASILKINVDSGRVIQDLDGGMEIAFRVSPESRWAAKSAAHALKDKMSVSVSPYRSVRSNRQNNLMWALLEVMGRSVGQTAWDCYVDMIEEAGAKYVYFECLKTDLPELKAQFRAVKEIEDRKDGKTVMCKCFYGSSKMDTKEMTQLIDAIFDHLSDLGVDTEDQQDMAYYWREWRDIR